MNTVLGCDVDSTHYYVLKEIEVVVVAFVAQAEAVVAFVPGCESGLVYVHLLNRVDHLQTELAFVF